MTRQVAAVFGGSGFIGRYVVKRLAAAGYTVRVPVRDPESALFLKPMGSVGQIVPLYASLGDPATLARAVEGAALVVNLIGILAESRNGDFQRIQADGAQAVALHAASAGADHFVQISAIGADPASASAYAATKGLGEERVRAAFPTAAILRPSIVFGPEDKFFNRFAAMAQFLPFMPVVCGDSLFQPVYVADVADAVLAAASRPGVFELGGPEQISFRDLLKFILSITGRNRPLVEIPLPIARIQAAVAEHLPGKPFTRDQLLMLQKDNVVDPGANTLTQLGITPTAYEVVVPAYLRRYRAGSQNPDKTASDV